MASVAEAFVTLRPDTDRFGGELKSKLGGLAGVAGAAMLGVGAAITGVAAAGIGEFSKLQAGMNEVFTLMPGVSQQAMGEMTEDVRDFSKEMGTLPGEVVPALYQALSAGVPPGNVFDFLETANKAALGGVTTLETAVDGISSVVNAYGEDILDAQRASDLMFTAVRLGKTTFEELSASLFQVIPTAAALGVGFEDVTGALAQMTAQGVPTSVATTQLRQLFVELSQEGTVASDAFKELAGVGMQQFIAEGGNTADVLDIMQQAAEDNGVSLQDMFGSVEAGQAALALAGDGTDDYRAKLEEMANSVGATDAAHEQMDQGIARSWERIKTNITVALGEIGERLAPTFQEFADWVIENMPAITDWVVGAFEAMADFITGTLVPAFQNMIAWWVENGPAIIERVVAVKDTIVEFGQRVVGWWQNDVKPSIDAFIAVIEDNWPSIERTLDSLGEVFENLGSIASSILEVISSAFGATTNDLDRDAAQMEGDLEGIIRALESFADAAADVSAGVSNRIEVMAGAVTGDTDRINRALYALSEEAFPGLMASVLSTMFEMRIGISNAINNVVGFFRDLPGRIRGALTGLGGLLYGIGRAIIGGLLDGIRSRWEDTRAFLSGLAAQIRRIKGPIEKDRVLLTDIGEEIIGGLGRGMASEWKNVERLLGTMTAEIPMQVSQVELDPLSLGHAGMVPFGSDTTRPQMPSTLVIVDVDGDLIGRMEVAADQRIVSAVGQVRPTGRAN